MPAIAAAKQRRFDAVIIDWRLPDGSGGDLIAPIKRELPNAPVIVVTGLREFDAAVTALREGAYDFLPKPINPDALRGLLARLVERKAHLVEIEQAQQKLVAKERLAAIGQMVAGLAHESRNAFQRSHACLAELSLDLEDMPESLELVHKVQKALDDVNGLLEEVRNYSAPVILERRKCKMRSLVDETWQQILEANAVQSEPNLVINCSDDVPRTWFIDGDRMRQVIRNLLENAIFACCDNGPITIDLCFVDSLVPSERRLILAVSDNGDGVDQDKREEIFSAFFTTKTKGTGLGLAISRRIVESHGGRLFVTDSPSGGAKFVIEIPVYDAKPHA
jgi:signal transduction histidine kinase